MGGILEKLGLRKQEPVVQKNETLAMWNRKIKII